MHSALSSAYCSTIDTKMFAARHPTQNYTQAASDNQIEPAITEISKSGLGLYRPTSTPPQALNPHPTRCTAPTASRACVDIQDLLVPPVTSASDNLWSTSAGHVV